MASKRYLVSGVLETTSSTCIRSGRTWKDILTAMPAGRRDRSFRPGHRMWGGRLEEQPDVDLVIRDARGLPYIPGSAIKGALRAFLQRLIRDPSFTIEDQHIETKHLTTLFGEPSETEASGSGGFAMFYDAHLDDRWLRRRRRGNAPVPGRYLPWWSERDLTYIETSVSIDRRTRTAAPAFLKFTEVVPPGVQFLLNILVDHEDSFLTRVIIEAIKGFNLPPAQAPIQIGSETNNGRGRLCWLGENLLVEQQAIDSGKSSATSSNVQAMVNRAREPLAIAPALLPELRTNPGGDRIEVERIVVTLHITLDFNSPFLVNDPSMCPLKPKNGDLNQPSDSDPDHYPRRTHDGRPLLPATSFHGALRSQLERITRTLADKAAVNPHAYMPDHIGDLPPQSPLRRLFGQTDMQSGFWCSDFEAKDQTANLERHEMVAIDRWTGGAATGLKYNVEAFDSPTLSGWLRLALTDDEQGLGMLGLMAMALSDLCEGDISFGYGRSKGFGQCTAKIGRATILGIRAGDTASTFWNQLVNVGFAFRSPDEADLPASGEQADGPSIIEGLDARVMVPTKLISALDSLVNACLRVTRQSINQWATPVSGE